MARIGQGKQGRGQHPTGSTGFYGISWNCTTGKGLISRGLGWVEMVGVWAG